MSAAEAELAPQPDVAPTEADSPRLPGVPFTSEKAKEARKLRGQGARNVPSDASIEASLRKAATSDPRAAETLIRWLQRPRAVASEDNLEALSMEELERLHEGLKALCSMGSEHVGHALRAMLNPT